MTTGLFLDYETYSSVDLRKYGAYPYVESPDFKPLMCAWWLGDAADTFLVPPEVRVAGQEQILDQIGDLLDDPHVIKIAQNAQFERLVSSLILDYPPGEFIDPVQYHDTAALAALNGYPRNLEKLARALGGEQKDTAGTRLINLFCKPQRVFNYERAYLPEEKPEDWAAFVEYCRQDVVTLIDVDLALGDWPTIYEHQVFLTDQRINDRGIRVDTDMASAAVTAFEENTATALAEMERITHLDNPNSRDQLLGWLRGHRDVPDLTKDTVEQLLTDPDLPAKVRRVLELRQETALVAAKKYKTASASATHGGRLRGQFFYHGAHTGRWSGRGVQLHNLTRHQLKKDGEWDRVGEMAAILDLKLGNGADADTLKSLVRAVLVGPFTVVDYAAIEARVLAWLADELWALQAFRDGRDIYVETATRMSTGKQQFTRRDGKIAVLALGYNGSVGSLQAMGAQGTDQDLQMIVDQWRATNQRIVSMWQQMDRAFRRGGPVGDGGHLRVDKRGNDRHLVLPSGRAIVYHDVRMRKIVTKFGTEKVVPTFIDPVKGIRVPTYGGRLTENVTQAVARDVLADALVRLDARGLRPVGHVHDEALCETRDLTAVTAAMTTQPDWAPDLPIDVAGFVTERYRKD